MSSTSAAIRSNGLERRYGRLVSLSLPCEGVSLARFVGHARGKPRCFWQNSRDNVAFAGMGVALEIMAWGAERFREIERQARQVFDHAAVLGEREPLAAPRLFGGFAFRDDFVPDQAWADFPPAHFVLPHYQLVQAGDACWLTLNAHVPPDDDPAALLPALRQALRAKIAELQAAEVAAPPPPTLTRLHYPLSLEHWTDGVETITARIQSGDLKKVVLARFAEASFSSPVDVDSALERLAHAYPDTYRFLFEPRPRCAFFGATPELLAQVQGHHVATMALAGSIRRGSSPAEDADLARQLLDSGKDRQEHQIVVDHIAARLAPLTAELRVGNTDVMTLSNIQHLHTPMEGSLQRASGVVPVLAALHPTPALGGEPREVAMELIAALEPFPRGWYAAPVGWIDYKLNGQFGVAIRSAVAQGQRAWLYAGAGIVAASDPQREWDETALKFRPMLEALAIK
ncbi:MAG: isochorismate synthase [Chloroflexaceae bacterium]|jgi:menaquinone-specific isochorismate synthase|nr:isochorismate synthase [Chloroflexaceae bacterium]